MPNLIWQTLYGRGLRSASEIESHFSPRLKDLTPPEALDGMSVAVDRLMAALAANEKICVYADFDLDGTSGLALLKRGLEVLGFQNIEHFQPRRLSDGYGFHAHVVDDLKARGVSLIVTVDVGITALEAVARAGELGVDVIVTDHHLPKDELPRALAILNPNKGSCSSGLGHLCGAGVAFYLVLGLKQEFQRRGLRAELDPKALLDCFVIGTLTDLVPLVKENRVLVKHGLFELARTRRPGLRALLEGLGLWGRPLSGSDVAIRFAPKLNALSRMEMGILPIDLFLVGDEKVAQSQVAEVLKNNERRVDLQGQAEQMAMEYVLSGPEKPCIWVWSEKFHKGVIGLVATKLAQRFGVPAFVGSLNESGFITGSARAPHAGGVNLLVALEAASLHLRKFGGHAPAAGFELSADQAEGFGLSLEAFYKADGEGRSQGPAGLAYDGAGTAEDIDETLMRWYEAMGPFGTRFEAPVYRLVNLRVQSFKWLKGQHLKLTLTGRRGSATTEALWFSAPTDHPFVRDGLAPGVLAEALVEPQWNHYLGRKTLQLLIKDIRKSGD